MSCVTPDCSFAPAAASGEVLCSGCSKSVTEDQLLALATLASSGIPATTRRKLVQHLLLAEGALKDEATNSLSRVAEGVKSQTTEPILVLEPPSNAEINHGASVNLVCEAISLAKTKLEYQWYKNDLPIPRAVRNRLSLFGAGPQDVGTYHCEVSSGGGSKPIRSRAASVTLSSEEQERLTAASKFLKEAETASNIEDALDLLRKAEDAAANVCKAEDIAEARCRRAELLLKSGLSTHFREAFEAASGALEAWPGLTRAHSVRGAAAEKLGLLAEAASSWEAADILGGIPGAAQKAEECRERLNKFFASRQSQRDFEKPKEKDKEEEDYEAKWKQQGWGSGRPSNSSSNSNFFGSSGCRGRSSQSNQTGLSAELRSHLQRLGLPIPTSARNLPSLEDVRKAYRSKALDLHPDKPGGSTKAFQELQTSYEALLQALGSTSS